MTKYISIIELEPNHFDYCISMYNHIRNTDCDSNIEIFVTSQGYENLKSEIFKIDTALTLNNIHKLKSKKHILIFFELLFNARGHIYWNTPFYSNDLYLQFIFIVFKRKFTLTIHNLNTNFGNSNKGIIKEAIKRYINRNVYNFVVLNEEIMKNLRKIVAKKIDVVSFKEKIKKDFYKSKHDSIIFTIPGTVNDKRRNYIDMIDVFVRIIDKYKNVKFIFLGKVISRNILDFLSHLSSEYRDNFIWFDYYLDQDEYNDFIIKSDCILAPLNKYIYQSGLLKEVYGETKASGAEFDAYKYGKKLLIPEFYKVDDDKIDVTYYSDNNDLYSEINNIILTIQRCL